MLKRHKRKRRPSWRPPELTEAVVLAWADAFHTSTGQWPSKKLGRLTVPGSGGERWVVLDGALRSGNRGLPGGSSLARLLAKHRGVRNRKGLSRLTYKQILVWADAWHKRTGEWPRENMDGSMIPESPGDDWHCIDDSIRRGLRGLPGRYSLAKLLGAKRGVRNIRNLPRLAEKQILAWTDEYHERTGKWPGQRVWHEAIQGSNGETWLKVDLALKLGLRGLKAGETLSDLLARTGRVRNVGRLPRLTVSQILGWADSYRKKHGNWPTCRGEPQEIPESFGERWFNIDQVLRKGMRGLPKGLSLTRVLNARRAN